MTSFWSSRKPLFSFWRCKVTDFFVTGKIFICILFKKVHFVDINQSLLSNTQEITYKNAQNTPFMHPYKNTCFIVFVKMVVDAFIIFIRHPSCRQIAQLTFNFHLSILIFSFRLSTLNFFHYLCSHKAVTSITSERSGNFWTVKDRDNF